MRADGFAASTEPDGPRKARAFGLSVKIIHMSEQEENAMKRDKKISRWIPIAAAVALVFATLNPVVAHDEPGDGLLELTVVADFGTFDLITTTNGGPFYVGGIVQDSDGDQVGLFHCWGFMFNGGAVGVVTQEYDLTGRGKIILTGVEDGGPRAVTGGTGDFREVRGEATGFDFTLFDSDGIFDVTLSLITHRHAFGHQRRIISSHPVSGLNFLDRP